MAGGNKRIFYAVESVGIAPCGSTSYTVVHGLQSFGISTRFNLEQMFEIGQLAIYQQVEGVPDIEVTMEKKLDGYPLIWHLATNPSAAATLVGRSNARASIGFNVFSDLQSSASGTPISQCDASGVYPSQLSYSMQAQGQATESVTFVGNSKVWNTSFSLAAFNNNDAPLAITGSGGVQNRQDFLLGSGLTKLPSDIPGVDSVTNYVYLDSTGTVENAHMSRVQIQASFGRESLYELGHKGPYHRYVNFPVEVKCDIEVIANDGDRVTAHQETDNLTNQPIYIKMREGSKFDLGTSNKLSNVTYGGANAGNNGGNATITFSYVTYNDLTITHPQDPSPGLAA